MATKTNSKQVKQSAPGKVKETPKMKNYEPAEEEIRELAEILYRQRIDRAEYGTAEEDWLQAEDYLKNQGN